MQSLFYGCAEPDNELVSDEKEPRAEKEHEANQSAGGLRFKAAGRGSRKRRWNHVLFQGCIKAEHLSIPFSGKIEDGTSKP